MTRVRNILYSFPVQLLLLHLRRYLFMLLPWLILFMMVTGNFLKRMGWHYLFLDPEYFGKVNMISFFIVGVALGGFIFIWNITSYILNSFRFPFLASFGSPFLRYSLNNSIIPVLFLATYFYFLIRFQFYAELKSLQEVLSYQGAMLAGMFLMLAVTTTHWLNIHTEKFLERRHRDSKRRSRNKVFRRWLFAGRSFHASGRELRVDYVLVHPFRVRHVRQVKHYPHYQLIKVFRYHHKNALLIEASALVLILLLGFLMDVPFFQIPASASILLMLSILLAPIGALSYWLRSWAVSASIVIFLLFNFMIKYGILDHRNQAFGWSYDSPVDYNLKNIEAAATGESLEVSLNSGLEMLNNWKKKVSGYYHPLQKPPLIVINASGGGLKAALWAFRLNQVADSLTQNRYFDHVVFVSGASGGMIGESFYRDLYVNKELGDSIDLNDHRFIHQVSKDLLNAVSFTHVINDVLFPVHGFEVSGSRYIKDRGRAFELRYRQNLGYIPKEKLIDYSAYEQQAISPMLVFAGTIIDDGRRLLVSPLPVAYLSAPAANADSTFPVKVDGIDARYFFRNQQGDSLSYSTAVRISATFPYIMPNVYLPTEPSVQVMDAGMRDNYGTEASIRFLYTFRDWINQNCSRVIILQARGDFEKDYEPQVIRHPSFVRKLLTPITSLYVNWSDYHDYIGDDLISVSESWLNVDVELLSFEYVPENKAEEASMSLHLTHRERLNILHTMNDIKNREKLEQLATFLSQ